MCLFVLLMFLGPRFGIIVAWLGWPARWEATFDTAILPIIGRPPNRHEGEKGFPSFTTDGRLPEATASAGRDPRLLL
jgi:hypothetical protein